MGLAILQSRSALRSTEHLSFENTANDMEDLMRRTPLKALSASRHLELLHNMGLELLLQNKSPEVAFHFLLSVVKVYPCNPRLWLRLAECCILVHRLVIFLFDFFTVLLIVSIITIHLYKLFINILFS